MDLSLAQEFGPHLADGEIAARFRLTRIEPVDLSAAPGLTPNTVEAYRVFGSLFFGSVGKLESLFDPVQRDGQPLPRYVIFDLDTMINLDTTGLDMLESLLHTLRKHEADLLICAANAQPASLFQRSGFAHLLGADHLQPSLTAALAHVAALQAAPAIAHEHA